MLDKYSAGLKYPPLFDADFKFLWDQLHALLNTGKFLYNMLLDTGAPGWAGVREGRSPPKPPPPVDPQPWLCSTGAAYGPCVLGAIKARIQSGGNVVGIKKRFGHSMRACWAPVPECMRMRGRNLDSAAAQEPWLELPDDAPERPIFEAVFHRYEALRIALKKRRREVADHFFDPALDGPAVGGQHTVNEGKANVFVDELVDGIMDPMMKARAARRPT